MKVNYKIFLLLISLIFIIGEAKSQTIAVDLQTYIQQTIDSAYEKEKIPGIFVAVLDNEKRSYFSSGFAKPEIKTHFDSTTVFEIGSITKTFTAYILMAVLHEKRISDTASIINFLPDSVQKNKNLLRISFISLMNHTSGLPRLPNNLKIENVRQPYENYSEKDLYAYLKVCTPMPDGKYNYSNLGAGLGGVLAERISGKTYAQLLDEYIFLPFKMVTEFNTVANSNNYSQGYFAKDDKTPYWNMNVLAPAGGLKCSGSEMLSYLQNLCFPQTKNAKKIISELTSQTVTINEKLAVGRGWHIFFEKDEPAIYWHNGGTYGFSTFCAFIKGSSKAVMVVINQTGKNNISDLLGIKIIKKMMSEK
ncbi:MAG TPA: serine hydrolase domain-containing protein [Ferruginibacter sp.]|nr:serine hydrolase domain-containing protein [Ferruginibacter sp.]